MNGKQWPDFDTAMAELKKGTINERAVAMILDYGSCDGSHHKQWALDQVLRLLAGDAYSHITKLWEGDPNDDDNYYGEWDTGIAP